MSDRWRMTAALINQLRRVYGDPLAGIRYGQPWQALTKPGPLARRRGREPRSREW